MMSATHVVSASFVNVRPGSVVDDHLSAESVVTTTIQLCKDFLQGHMSFFAKRRGTVESYRCDHRLTNPVMGTLKLQSNVHSITVIDTLAAMGGLLHLVQRVWAWEGCGPTQSLPCCTKCNSPPINGQCTNFMLVAVAL